MKTLNLERLLELVSSSLEQAGIDHILIGGLAVGLRGYPRSTLDVDMLAPEKQVDLICNVLNGLGFERVADTEETLHFTGPGNVDFLIARRQISLQMLQRGTRVEGLKTKVALVEDIIGLKIQAYHNDSSRKWKDQADIAELIRSNPELNWKEVLGYANLFDAEAELEQIRNHILK